MKKYKLLLAGFCCCALGQSLQAQTFNEWFRQSKTRKKYLIKQIAALEDLLLTGEKGWRIAEAGIRDIGQIKNGEFNMHQAFFQSLKTINPLIKNDRIIQDIILQEEILTEDLMESFGIWQKSPFLQPKEINTIARMVEQLVESGEQLADALRVLTTDNSYQLSDGERLNAIHVLNLEFTRYSSQAKAFMDGTNRLIAQRQQEAAELSLLKKFFYE